MTARAILILMALLGGCGATEYRIVRSVHEVTLSREVALVRTSATVPADAALLAAIDDGLSRGLAASAPGHVFESGLTDPQFTLSVVLSQIDHRERGTTIAADVTIVETRGRRVVDEIEVSFDHPGEPAAAGEELGQRVGHYLHHREGYHL